LVFEKPWIYFELLKALNHVFLGLSPYFHYLGREISNLTNTMLSGVKKARDCACFQSEKRQKLCIHKSMIDCGTTAIFASALKNKIKCSPLSPQKPKTWVFLFQSNFRSLSLGHQRTLYNQTD
jgi:hypothetical protein